MREPVKRKVCVQFDEIYNIFFLRYSGRSLVIRLYCVQHDESKFITFFCAIVGEEDCL